ncbi:DUF6398 domain-containing protein [Flammeovirga sp. EKP202]|uniref:DUF6398 domain-containing protein n=1 Tax=Flammeovirga sp. EKP202 TaxID=2770592 RepID=UPI00165FBDAD|nr:DUF6398 domain-containing protein [Flammeovirga sp. EKP202]MBD0403881.1 hypothetical protein [Flammeovirga sp. EKP202]
MDKVKIKEREAELESMISAFCTEHLNEEYKTLCVKLLQKLGRKRDVPFARGKLDIWAASIIHTIGTVNFLSDSSFEPYMSLNDMCDKMGVKSSTVGNKAGAIRKLLKLQRFDKEFSTQRMVEENPFRKIEELYALYSPVEVDGEYVDFRSLPQEVQQEVIEARKNGYDMEYTTYKK